jgi:hypothetical protein
MENREYSNSAQTENFNKWFTLSFCLTIFFSPLVSLLCLFLVKQNIGKYAVCLGVAFGCLIQGIFWIIFSFAYETICNKGCVIIVNGEKTTITYGSCSTSCRFFTSFYQVTGLVLLLICTILITVSRLYGNKIKIVLGSLSNRREGKIQTNKYLHNCQGKF